MSVKEAARKNDDGLFLSQRLTPSRSVVPSLESLGHIKNNWHLVPVHAQDQYQIPQFTDDFCKLDLEEYKFASVSYCQFPSRTFRIAPRNTKKSISHGKKKKGNRLAKHIFAMPHVTIWTCYVSDSHTNRTMGVMLGETVG